MDGEDQEALRRRLYRPGASAADLATYLHVAAAEAPAEVAAEAEPGPGPSLRPFAVGASVVAGAALLGGLLLSGVLTPQTVAPTVLAATPAPAATVDPGSGQVEFVTATVLDGGRARHATGAAVPEGPDRYRYTIASGDTVQGIAARFGVCTGDVLVALPYGVDPARLQIDQTVELAKLTSTTC